MPSHPRGAWSCLGVKGLVNTTWSFWFLLVLLPTLKLENFLDPKLDINENGRNLVFGAQRKV